MTLEASSVRPVLTVDSWALLAGLRFALAFIVVCGHLFRFAPNDSFFNSQFIRVGAFDAVEAVIGFLLISGFSIAHSLSKRPDGYFRRRFLRIYPLYVVGVAFAVVPFLFAGSKIETFNTVFAAPTAASVACNLALMQGFLCLPIPSNGPLWSLSVEAFFYVIAPLLIKLRAKAVLAIIAISAVAYALVPWLDLPFYSQLTLGRGVMLLAWAWVSGFLFYFNRDKPAYKLGLLFVGLALIAFNHVFNTKLSLFTYLMSAGVIIYASRISLNQTLVRALNYLGDLSYPLYVLHVPVFIFAYAVLDTRFAPVLVGLSLLMAIFFYHAVDHPLRSGSRKRGHARRLLASGIKLDPTG